ncbi:MAG: carboxypeptidase-like regulatory domain-containing protein [Pyrinomonadaceae bacterium]
MNDQKFDINKLRVASPCSVGWNSMTGDERVRRCHSCQLNIYNTAEMTKNEIERLIQDYEGRLCIRLYKRADGTVLTKDCPVGVLAYRKKAVRLAGASMTAILSLFTVSFGQQDNVDKIDAKSKKIKITRSETQKKENNLKGTVVDQNGAVIPNATIRLFKKGEKISIDTKSRDDGSYSFWSLMDGIYRIEVSIRYGGFRKLVIDKLNIRSGQTVAIDLTLTATGEVVGVIAEPDKNPP